MARGYHGSLAAERGPVSCSALSGGGLEAALIRWRPGFFELEKLSHAYAILDLEPKALIETNRIFIRSAHLEIDLGSTEWS
jgi:hypothetical protein